MITVAGTEADRRLHRLRRVAWLLDRSIPLGRGWRIGLDPLLGLIPGAGDALAALLSLYIFYEGARLGLPAVILARMAANIAVEAIVGAVPVAGDLFDFVWQANMRNLRLVERHYHPELPARSLAALWWIVGGLLLALLGAVAGAVFLLVQLAQALWP